MNRGCILTVMVVPTIFRFLPLTGAALALLLVGCPSGLQGDDDSASEAMRCSASWTSVPADGRFVFVDEVAEAGGDGSLEAPVQTLTEGLELARSTQAGYVLVYDGLYPATSAQPTFALGPGDDDLVIVGCGADTVVQGGDPQLPVFEIAGDVGGVELRNLAVDGGRRAVVIRDGAGSGAPIGLDGVTVQDSRRLAISIADVGTRAILRDVTVQGVDADGDGSLGYGVHVADAAVVTMESVTIDDATRVGLVIDGTGFGISDLVVTNTRPWADTLGRGVHLQNNANGAWSGGLVADNADAGVFLFRPGPVELADLVLRDTALSDVEGAPGVQSGAGMVATSNLFVDPGNPVEPRPLELSGCTFSDNARLGALVEGLGTEVTADGNVFTGNFIPDEETFPVADTLYFQRGATVEVTSGDLAEELPEELEQTILREELPLDAPD